MPWAWAGRHRLPPVAEGDSIGSRATGYYVVLEARRHTADGRTAVAGVLIWAHPAVPDRGRSLAELFRERTEVGLTVYPPSTAPDSADVFDYEEPTTAGRRLLFSVRPVPPEQGTAKELAFERGSRGWSTWLVLGVIALGLSVTSRPVERFALLAALVWLRGARARRGGASVSSRCSRRPRSSGRCSARSPAPPACWRSRAPCSPSAASGSGAGGCRRRWYGVAARRRAAARARRISSAAWGAGITPPADGVSDRALA